MPDLGRRLANNPILTNTGVVPSQPGLEVVSVFNAAAARVGDEVVLLLRVAERPRTLTDAVPADAQTIDLAHPDRGLYPLPSGIPAENLVGLSYFDATRKQPSVVIAYVRRDLPGLDLNDPRRIRVHMPAEHLGDQEDVRDYLTQMSHLRVARSSDGEHVESENTPAVSASDSFEVYGCVDPRATWSAGGLHNR